MESGFLINHTFQRISARIGNFIMYTLGPFFRGNEFTIMFVCYIRIELQSRILGS